MLDDRDEDADQDRDGLDTLYDEALVRRVDRVMARYRTGLTEEEWQEHRRMLLFLAKTHPRFSTWVDDIQPREVPDGSGVAAKKGSASLEAAARSARGKAAGGDRS
jgi:hypothetical protein